MAIVAVTLSSPGRFSPSGRLYDSVPTMSLDTSAAGAAMSAPRTNEQWVASLTGAGQTLRDAQRDLRILLIKGLRRTLLSRGAPADLCEDVAQEALLRIRERLGDFRGDARFSTWCLAIATRLAFDELRHKRWKDVSFQQVTTDAELPLTFEPATDASQEKTLVRERVLRELQDVLEQKLTERQRSILVAELNGMPHAEIATVFGMNRNALYKLSHDARKRVKHHLEAAGVSDRDVLWAFE